MKKYFMIGLGIVLALSLTIILYGTWACSTVRRIT